MTKEQCIHPPQTRTEFIRNFLQPEQLKHMLSYICVTVCILLIISFVFGNLSIHWRWSHCFIAVLLETFSVEKDDPKSGRYMLTLEPLFYGTQIKVSWKTVEKDDPKSGRHLKSIFYLIPSPHNPPWYKNKSWLKNDQKSVGWMDKISEMSIFRWTQKWTWPKF